MKSTVDLLINSEAHFSHIYNIFFLILETAIKYSYELKAKFHLFFIFLNHI